MKLFLFKKNPINFLSVSLIAVCMIILGIIALPGLISMPVYGQAASAWNLQKVGTDLNICYDSSCGTVMYLKSAASGGNIGVGTNNPTGKFQIDTPNGAGVDGTAPLVLNRGYATVGDYQDIVFGGGNGNISGRAGIIRSIAHAAGEGGIAFLTQTGSGDAATHESMRIQGNGYVGINTNAPSGLFHVKGPNATNMVNFLESVGGGSYLEMGTAAGGFVELNADASGNFNLSTNGVAGGVMRMVRAGSVGNTLVLQNNKVGIRMASAPTHDLHIKQSTNSQTSGGIKLERSDTAGFGTIFEGGDNQLYLFTNSNAQQCILTTSATWSCSSDRRQKENIGPLLGSALDVLAQLKPSTFTWKDGGKPSAGFIAQEVAEVLPDAVTKGENGYYALSDSYFTPYLVKGVQELNAKNKELSEKLDKQQTEIDLLKQQIEELKKN